MALSAFGTQILYTLAANDVHARPTAFLNPATLAPGKMLQHVPLSSHSRPNHPSLYAKPPLRHAKLIIAQNPSKCWAEPPLFRRNYARWHKAGATRQDAKRGLSHFTQMQPHRKKTVDFFAGAGRGLVLVTCRKTPRTEVSWGRWTTFSVSQLLAHVERLLHVIPPNNAENKKSSMTFSYVPFSSRPGPPHTN